MDALSIGFSIIIMGLAFLFGIGSVLDSIDKYNAKKKNEENDD